MKTTTIIHGPPHNLVEPPQQCHTQNGHYCIQDGCREGGERREGEEGGRGEREGEEGGRERREGERERREGGGRERREGEGSMSMEAAHRAGFHREK